MHRNLLQGMWVQEKKNQNKPLSSSMGREKKSCLPEGASGSFEIHCVFCLYVRSFAFFTDNQGGTRGGSNCFFFFFLERAEIRGSPVLSQSDGVPGLQVTAYVHTARYPKKNLCVTVLFLV